MRAWPCSTRALAAAGLTLLLGACASSGGRHAVDLPWPAADNAPPACRDYVAAWVARFRDNVAHLDGRTDAGTQRLEQARARLAGEGVAESACERPYCIIRPLGDGRLDSWCGYRAPDPSGAQLYRWIPYREPSR